MTVLLGLLTAVSYGSADFFAALATKRMRVIFVSALSSVAGLIVQLLLIPVFGADFSTQAVLWGLTAGLFSVAALTSLYASLAIGPISIVSPLGAVISAIVPAIIGSAIVGDSLSTQGWLAIAIALVAVVLVGFIPGEKITRPKPKAIILAIAAGISIGLAVSSLAQSPHDSGIATIIVMRATAASILLIFMLVAAKKYRDQKFERNTILLILGAGALDAMANMLFTFASRSGSLTEAGVLTALYPLGTILLARVILKEHVSNVQKLGIALTLVASLLLALA